MDERERLVEAVAERMLNDPGMKAQQALRCAEIAVRLAEHTRDRAAQIAHDRSSDVSVWHGVDSMGITLPEGE